MTTIEQPFSYFLWGKKVLQRTLDGGNPAENAGAVAMELFITASPDFD